MGGWSLWALDVEADRPEAIGDDAIASLVPALARFLGLDQPARVRHAFEPHGLSDVAITEAGRVAVHTWPEHGRATVDLWAPDERMSGRLDTLIELLAARGLRVIGRFSARRGGPPRPPS